MAFSKASVKSKKLIYHSTKPTSSCSITSISLFNLNPSSYTLLLDPSYPSWEPKPWGIAPFLILFWIHSNYDIIYFRNITPIEMIRTNISSAPYSFNSSIIHVIINDDIYHHLDPHLFPWFCSEAFTHALINNCVLDLPYFNLIHSFYITGCCLIKISSSLD